MNCRNLNSINIPDHVTVIGKQAFSQCFALKSLTLPESISEIGESAFEKCDLLSLSVASGSFSEQYCIENNIRYTARRD